MINPKNVANTAIRESNPGFKIMLNIFQDIVTAFINTPNYGNTRFPVATDFIRKCNEML